MLVDGKTIVVYICLAVFIGFSCGCCCNIREADHVSASCLSASVQQVLTVYLQDSRAIYSCGLLHLP